MRIKSFLYLLSVIPLVSCSTNSYPISKELFCFDTANYLNLYEGSEEDLDGIGKIFSKYDSLTDNYKDRDVSNLNKINKTNEDVQISKELYDLLKISVDYSKDIKLFNPLCGLLAKKWKESLKELQILDNNTISKELEKINNSSLLFKENNVVQRVGEAEIDLGAITKGYVLDRAKEYLDSKQLSKYLINAGYSSILLGEKTSNDGYFNVGLTSLSNSYLKLKSCVLSTSGVSEQGKVINDITYSHIVNPITGNVINNYDAVTVITSNATIGDVLSTVMMLSSISEIKELENKYNAKALAIKDKKIVYLNDGLEVLKH